MAMRGWLRRLFLWGGFTAIALLVLLVAAYGLLQTSPGLGWAARTLANLASTQGFSVSIKGLAASSRLTSTPSASRSATRKASGSGLTTRKSTCRQPR